jgi:hypothetical protein
MVRNTLVLALLATVSMAIPSRAQPYLNGAPPGGVGTYSSRPYGNVDDPRFRNDNWRSNSPDDWRANNWREDRSGDWGTWRRNNWREDRAADDWRQNYRDEKETKEIEAKKKEVEKATEGNNINENDCSMTASRSVDSSNAPCRRP